MITTITAEDVRVGDKLDLYSGLDFNRTGLTRDWHPVIKIEREGEDFVIYFEHRSKHTCSPGWLFQKQTLKKDKQ